MNAILSRKCADFIFAIFASLKDLQSGKQYIYILNFNLNGAVKNFSRRENMSEVEGERLQRYEKKKKNA